MGVGPRWWPTFFFPPNYPEIRGVVITLLWLIQFGKPREEPTFKKSVEKSLKDPTKHFQGWKL